MGAYLRSQVTQTLLAGLLLGLGFWLLGSPYPVLLAFASALACLIPVVGPALALIPPLVVGLLTSVQLSLFSALYALAVLIRPGSMGEPTAFQPRLGQCHSDCRSAHCPGDAFGLAGIIVAPPLSVVCQILWSRLIIHRRGAGAAAQLSNLKERQERVWGAIRTIDEPYLPLVTSSMERLAQLIAKAEPVLQAAPPAEPFEQLQHGARRIRNGGAECVTCVPN